MRELGHGLYLMWIMLNFTFVWAVGVSRFTDNKHNISDILGGWMMGFAFALVYASRSTCLHKYVVMHGVVEVEECAQFASTKSTADNQAATNKSPVEPEETSAP